MDTSQKGELDFRGIEWFLAIAYDFARLLPLRFIAFLFDHPLPGVARKRKHPIEVLG